MDSVHLVGNFPPPVTGQTLATQRLAALLDSGFVVHCVDTSTGSTGAIQAKTQFSPGKVQQSVKLRRRLWTALQTTPGTPVLWASISPTVPGHWRDVLTVLPALPGSSPVYAIIHWGDFERVFRQPLTAHTARRIVHRLSGFVFLNDQLADACAAWIPASKRLVIPNTLDTAVICTEEEIAAKQAARRDRQPLRLLFLSNMIPSKGYLDVLHAVLLLHERGVVVQADFAGRWTTDTNRTAFERFVDAEGLEKVVTHHGGVTDRARIKALHLQADVFLLPTYYPTEAQPVSILEALNAGTPIVTTPHAGIPAMVNQDREACFVPPRSPEAIAEAVQHLTDVPYWLALSAHARRRFTAQFSPEAVRQQWETLLTAP